MGGGIITVAGLLILSLLLTVFPEIGTNFRTLPPIEQNLIRASNGFALMGSSGNIRISRSLCGDQIMPMRFRN